jgi:soluble lytic murein transglycosylase-like protein
MATKAQQLPVEIARLLDAAAGMSRVSASLARAVAWIESRGDAKAESPVKAAGVMQLMPATAKDLGVADVFDPAQNIAAGVAYLSRLLRKYNGNEALALAAYNWGPGHVDTALDSGTPLPQEVQAYVRNVQARKAEEGNRSAAAPFFAACSLALRCPHCLHDVSLNVETELKR